MKRRIIMSTPAILLILILVHAPWAEAAKMRVKSRDYSALWQEYTLRDSKRTPAKTYPYEDCFQKAAREYEVPLTMLLALARGESDFNPRAKSSKSCHGIMQIQWPGTAKDLGFTRLKDLYKPCRNIKAGAKYIKMLLDRYNGDLHLALAAYNYGLGRIKRGMSASAVPKGAVWYSGYIYHHLQRVLAGSFEKPVKISTRPKYKPGQKLPLILFHSPYRARGFLAYFKENAPTVRLDWFRTSLGETYIVMLFDNYEEKTRGIKRLEELGYSVDESQGFY